MKQNIVLHQKLTGEFNLMVRNAQNVLVMNASMGTERKSAIEKVNQLLAIMGSADGFTDQTA